MVLHKRKITALCLSVIMAGSLAVPSRAEVRAAEIETAEAAAGEAERAKAAVEKTEKAEPAELADPAAKAAGQKNVRRASESSAERNPEKIASGSNADRDEDMQEENEEVPGGEITGEPGNKPTGSTPTATPSNALMAPRSLPDGSYLNENGIYTFEAEYFYTAAEPSADGQAANLQPHTGIQIPLNELAEFEAGQYMVEILYAGNSQTLTVGTVGAAGADGAGSLSGAGGTGGITVRAVCPDIGFNWDGRAIAVGDGLLNLTGGETLTVQAVTDGKYGWIDWVRLTPVDGLLLEAKDFVDPADKVTGDDGSCANMDPGVTLKIPSGGRFHGAAYELMMWTCGNGRSYEVQINGVKAGGYVTSGSDFGMANLHEDGWQGRYELKDGDVLTVIAPDGSYGWIKGILLRELPEKFYQKDPATGIIVEADEDVLPKGTQLKVRQVSDRECDEQFEENGLRAVYYEIQLKRPSGRALRASDDPGTGLFIEIPLPPGFSRLDESTDIYHVSSGEAECLHGAWSADGRSVRAMMEPLEDGSSTYALTTKAGAYRYEAEDYYGALTDGGKAANFETGNGDTLAFRAEKKDGFVSGVYNLLLRYCGGGDKPLEVLVNQTPVGTVKLPYTDWGDYRLQAAAAVLNIRPGDEVAIRTPEGQYHWIDCLELKEAEPFEVQVNGVTASAPVGTLPYGAQMAMEEADGDPEAEFLRERLSGSTDMRVFRLSFYLDDPDQPLIPAGPVQIRMEFPEGYHADKFCLYHVSGNGLGMRGMKVPCALDGNEISFEINGETGVFALADSAAYVPAGYDDEAIYTRGGGKRRDGRDTGFTTQVRTRTADGRYIYEGEAYYKALGDKPAADLQPGAQLTFRLADNPDFSRGNYRLTVRSNGNRQMFVVKVNHEQVGAINRYGTDFSMQSMTDDSLERALTLEPSDLLTIEGEGGQNYGWVDFVALERVTEKDGGESGSATGGTSRTGAAGGTGGISATGATGGTGGTDGTGVTSGTNATSATVAGHRDVSQAAPLTYRARDYYEKKTEDGMYADLQPGEAIQFRAGDHPDFKEGVYRIAVTSNGNRTRLLVRQNGAALGSVVRVYGNGFDPTDMTRNVLGRNILVKADDVITLEAPGNNPDEGPWGWVDGIELVQPPSGTGTAKGEYRYEGEDYYPASLYSPAADLQAGESIHIPLSDDPDFAPGAYRLSVLSNGTRQRFDVLVNGRPVGVIRKKAADYSDIDYSQDYMEGVISLAPGDVLTLTGQEGDHFGWVNYVLLERED